MPTGASRAAKMREERIFAFFQSVMVLIEFMSVGEVVGTFSRKTIELL
jgi:hypothetical protein